MEQIEYKYGSKIIKAEIQYSNRKTLDLRVFPEGNVIVTAPLNTVDYKILEKVKLKSKWILQQQRTFELYKPFTAEKLYIPGETHRYLGRQYKLVINKIKKGRTSFNLSKGLMTITTKSNDTEKLINQYYKLKADEVFGKILSDLLIEFPIFTTYNISLKHKMLKKRWGSCSTDGNILLNTELIKASKNCIEYVILHELCHLINPNHSKAFYNLLTELLPNWQKIKNKLEISLA